MMRVTGVKLAVALVSLGCVWSIILLHVSLNQSTVPSKPEPLQDEILSLSEKYVRLLAKDTKNTVDGPYSGRLTGYDMKKTMAVLLENMMDRMTVLENKLDAILQNNSSLSKRSLQQPDNFMGRVPLVSGSPNSEVDGPVHAKELLLGAQEECLPTEEEDKAFPACKPKMAWMKNFWKSDQCYAEFGVDGSDCSMRVYLSEVENWCPVLKGRTGSFNVSGSSDKQKAELNMNLEGLMKLLADPGQRENYAWIRQRIQGMWKNWVNAAQSLAARENLHDRPRKRILVHLGLLSQKSGFKIPETSFKGGPLGELVQWSDIISALYILGHELTITSEVDQLSVSVFGGMTGRRGSCKLVGRSFGMSQLIITDITGLKQIKVATRYQYQSLRILSKFPSAEAQCQSRTQLPLDMLVTDIVGLTQFKRKVKNGYGKFSCLLRIIDSFGTEPAYNYDLYAKTHQMKTNWGMQNLQPQQFFTMFPHSPDNSFMGFVVENYLNGTVHRDSPRKNQAVVYGKAEGMWQGKEPYLSVIHKHAEIHGTVFLEKGAASIVPSYVHNHGILSGPDLHQLLRESKLFIGLGFPYEGPAPLEAIAQGCVFINPKFNPPHSSQNNKFFRGKPTNRQVTSQHPYAEVYIGEPNVYTVDMDDKVAVEEAVIAALKGPNPEPYMPYEFTKEGMLQRVNAYIQHQDFCGGSGVTGSNIWPPTSAIKVMTSKLGQSCKNACHDNGLICEPSHFQRINNQKSLEDAFNKTCSSVFTHSDIYYPGMSTASGTCILQKQNLLFSCVGELADLNRLCPCRDFIKGQTALCDSCL